MISPGDLRQTGKRHHQCSLDGRITPFGSLPRIRILDFHVCSPLQTLAKSHQLKKRFFADVATVILGQFGQRFRTAAQGEPVVDRAAIAPPRRLEQPLVVVAQAEFETRMFTLIDDDVFAS